MKLKRIQMLIIPIVLLGVSWGVAFRGNTKPSKAVAKNIVRPHVPDAKSKSGPASDSPKKLLARLTGISIRAANDGSGTTIDISTSRPSAYHVLHLEHPDRVVLDLDGARNITHRWEYSSHSPLLQRVRVGIFSSKYGGIIRIVADLERHPVYSVDPGPKGFRIELSSRGNARHGETTRKNAKGPRPTTPVPSGKRVAYRKVAASNTLAPVTNLKVKERHGERRASTIALRWNPTAPIVYPAPAPPESSNPLPRPKQRKDRALPEAAKAANATRLVTTARAAALNSAGPTAASSVDPENSQKYTGKRISLNLKEVDLKDFFRLIHEVSGLNIIVDPDVSGTVTIVLDDVPWDQALALVLNDNGLGDRLEGNVLRIAKLSTLTREQEEQQKLSIAREDSAPLVTVFRTVNYAKASTIAALLKIWAGGGALSHRGSVLVDKRSNTLIISDIESHIPRIESVITKLDRKAQQVSIQARIIRATSDFARNLSTALSFAQRNGSGSIVTGGATGNPVSGQPLTPPTVTTAPATGFGVFVLSNLGSNYAINAAISAAETRDQAKTISQPSIVTQNNVEGTVIQGTQIPIQTTINNTISVQYVQASLELKVTPQVTQDGNVFLTIDVQNSSPGPALTFAGPTINTQSATTQVLVPNGGTVVFGGVTVHTKSNSSTGIPWVESIPILGHLFKSSTVQKNDQELLFFVTPKILTS